MEQRPTGAVDSVAVVKQRMNEGHHDIGYWLETPEVSPKIDRMMREQGLDPDALARAGKWHDAAVMMLRDLVLVQPPPKGGA